MTAAGPPVRRVLVDGGSGAGKSTFARRLVAAWSRLSGEPVQLVSMDDFYPGWSGLAEGSRIVVDDVLSSDRPGYRRWDWARQEPGEWVELDRTRPMVIEGCGALTPASAALAQLSFWLQLQEQERKGRALTRDGEGFAPWWDAWAAQEQLHWAAHRPWRLASFTVQTAP